MKTVHIDWSEFQEANDEKYATSHYGGYIIVNGKKHAASGTDRGGDLQKILRDAVNEALGRELTCEELEYLENNCEVWYYYDKNGTLLFEDTGFISWTLDVPEPELEPIFNTRRPATFDFDVVYDFSLDTLSKEILSCLENPESKVYIDPRGPGGGNTNVLIFTTDGDDITRVKQYMDKWKLGIEHS